MKNYLIGLLCFIVISVILSLIVPIVILLVYGCVTAFVWFENDMLKRRSLERNTDHDSGIADLNNDTPKDGDVDVDDQINDTTVGGTEKKSL